MRTRHPSGTAREHRLLAQQRALLRTAPDPAQEVLRAMARGNPMVFYDREEIERAAGGMAAALGGPVSCAAILGSGFAPLVEILEDRRAIPFRDVPGFSPCSAPGHEGEIVAGTLGKARFLFFSGRLHLYDGLSAEEVVVPVAFARALGADRVLLTSAAGSTTEGHTPGEILLVEDHLNMTGENPILAIPPASRRPQYLAMGDAYDRRALDLAERLAADHKVRVRRGVLAALTGPSFETPAEYRALERLGADVVSMSCALETIAARALGLRVLALAIVANGPAKLGDAGALGDEVLRVVTGSVCDHLGYLRALLTEFPSI